MTAEFRRELQQRKPAPEERHDAGPALPGPHGLLRPRPPLGARGARPGPRGRRRSPRYLDSARDLPRSTKEKIAEVVLPRDREPGRLPGRPPAQGGRSRRWPRPRSSRGVEAPARRERARAGGGPGRPAHPRHRAPRGPPHRQPAARPRRPPGRPRLVALLPLARGRPDAHLRLRAHQRAHAAARAWRRASRSSTAWSRSRSSGRRSRWRRRTSPSASTCSSTTT